MSAPHEEPVDPDMAFWAELENERFGQWLHHPMTKRFMAFLKHRDDMLKAAAIGLWQAGQFRDPSKSQSEELRGRTLELSDVRAVTLQGLRDFYAERFAATQATEE